MNLHEIKVNEGRRLSFFQLFSNEGFRIEIPIIQRDYAQGRKSAHEVRTEFLKTLYAYLYDNKPYRDLDFVYGSITRSSNGQSTLVVLDGQQRLTTLFLLHWYLAVRSGNMEILRGRLIDGNKSRFTYETRSSSKEFCSALLNNDISPSSENKSISTVVMDAGWYFQLWKYDPTIQSMLTMIDAIEKEFRENPEFFGRLTRDDSPVITFQFLDIGALHLTDDLYIKMNSRGKPLTFFENFKAKLEKEIDIQFQSSDLKWQFQYGEKDREMSASAYFSHSIDTKWIDYFWNKRNTAQKKDVTDEHIMNFIRVILANYYAIDDHQEKDHDRYLKILLDTQDAKNDPAYSPELSFSNCKEWGVFSKASVQGLIASFDALLLLEKTNPSLFPSGQHYDHAAVLGDLFNQKLEFVARIRLHGCLRYIASGKNLAELRNWMRVLFNLTENSFFDDTRAVSNALKEVEKLLPYADNILHYFAYGKKEIGAFYGPQIEEERIKACLMLKNNRWAAMIQEIEHHDFVKGQIGFLLEFSRMPDHDTSEISNWTEQQDIDFQETFKRYAEKSTSLFNYLQRRKGDEKAFLWERAVLTKGDYLITASHWRKNFLHSPANTRDYSWKRLLRLNARAGHNDEHRYRRNLIKKVFDDPAFNYSQLEDSCKVLINNAPQSAWWTPFIAEPRLIKLCEKGFIRHDQVSGSIRLLTTSKLTYHYELLTYLLYIREIEGKTFEPFSNVTYSWDYGETGVPKIKFTGLKYGNNHYGIDIFNSGSLWVNFKLTNNNPGNFDNYDAAVRTALKQSDTEYEDFKIGGFSVVETPSTVMQRITSICEHLQSL